MPQWQHPVGSFVLVAFVVAAMAGAIVEVHAVAQAGGPLLVEDSHAPAATRATTVTRPRLIPRRVAPTPESTGVVRYLGQLGDMAAGAQIIFLDRLEMVQGEPSQVRAFLTLDADAAAPDPAVAGLTDEFTAGHLISARLIEDCDAECSFEIGNTGWLERRVEMVAAEPNIDPSDDILEWTWEVVPLQAGTYSLRLEIETVAFIETTTESLETADPVAFERTASAAVDDNPAFEMLDLHTDLGRYTVLIEAAEIRNPHVIEAGDSFLLTASREELGTTARSFQSSVDLAARDDSLAQVQRAGPRRGEVQDDMRSWSWLVRGLKGGTTNLVLSVDAALDVGGERHEAHDELAIELQVAGRPAAAVLEEGFEAGNWIVAAAVGLATVVAGAVTVRLIRSRRARPWRIVGGAESDERGPEA